MSHVEIYREIEGRPTGRVDTATSSVQRRYTATGKWRWRFVHTNGRIMADSGEGYVKRTACLHGAATVTGGTLDALPDGNPVICRLGLDGTCANDLPVIDLTRAKP